MNRLKCCEVRCIKCRRWFCSQVLQFESAETFLSTVMYNNTEPCPHCNTIITHDKEIMRFVEKDSNGKIIKETRYVYDF